LALLFFHKKGRESKLDLLSFRNALKSSASSLKASASQLKFYDFHGTELSENSAHEK
jgi:hypothetical protein